MSEEQTEVTTETVTPELENARKTAHRFGWRPQSEWTGEPDAWVDADVFLERGKEYNGFLRKENEGLKHRLEELETTMREFKDHHTKVAQQAYEKALKDVKEARKQALKEGNLELVAELEDRLEEVQAEAKPAPQPKIDPNAERTFNEWISENQWYQNNEAARLIAERVGQDWQGKLTGRAFLDKVAEGVRRVMPDVFENTARKSAPAVDTSGTTGTPSRKGKTYSDLPEDAKKACDRFVKQKLMTKEQYVKEFFEGEE